MHLERYVINAYNDNKVFGFWSEGPNGPVAKMVVCQQITGNIYNLAFGDWDFEKEALDDLSRTNNGDLRKVLATVAFAIRLFMQSNPSATLLIQGSTKARVRLYQMAITKYHREITQHFEITGFSQGVAERFLPGKNYEAFAIKNRTNLTFTL